MPGRMVYFTVQKNDNNYRNGNNNNNNRNNNYNNNNNRILEIAQKVLSTSKISLNDIQSKYLDDNGESKWDADYYVKNNKLNVREEIEHEFKYYQIFSKFKGTTDTELIIHTTEKYINGFINTKGGTLYKKKTQKNNK